MTLTEAELQALFRATGHLTNGQAWDCAALAKRFAEGANFDELKQLAEQFRSEAYDNRKD